MSRIYCRIITADHSQRTETQIVGFFLEKLKLVNADDFSFTQLAPYHKIEGAGEMCISFLCRKPLASIQSLFADSWNSGTTDHRQGSIYCPQAVFLWISQ